MNVLQSHNENLSKDPCRKLALLFSRRERQKRNSSSKHTDFRKWRLPYVLESTDVYNLEHKTLVSFGSVCLASVRNI